MRKIELIELVQDFLTGGDAPGDLRGRFHESVIRGHIENAFLGVVFQTYLEAKRYSDYSVLDAWAMNYDRPITGLAAGKGLVTLPFIPVQLPNNMGILQVSCADDLTKVFAYRETNSNAVFAVLDVGTSSSMPFFYLEMNNNPSTYHSHHLKVEKVPVGCTSVAVKMIVPLSALDDFDHVAVPAGKESLIVSETIELMMAKPPEDDVNDNKAAR